MKLKLPFPKFRSYIINNPIATSLTLLLICSITTVALTLFTTKGGYDGDMYKNILVEVHGMLIELLILGIFLYWLNKFGEQKQNIKRLQDELRYYYEYTGSETTFHVSKIIKQLNNYKIYTFSFIRIFLENASLPGTKFEKTDFIGNWLSDSFFERSIFIDCNFLSCSCDRINLSETNISHTKFIEGTLERAIFLKCDIFSVNFKQCYLANSNFSNSYLSNCIFDRNSLEKSSFKNSVLENCDLTNNNILISADFTNATFKSCKLLKTDLHLFSNAILLDTILL
jgi:uncharacterized protein YjbI with pentapeptide repeats